MRIAINKNSIHQYLGEWVDVIINTKSIEMSHLQSWNYNMQLSALFFKQKLLFRLHVIQAVEKVYCTKIPGY